MDCVSVSGRRVLQMVVRHDDLTQRTLAGLHTARSASKASSRSARSERYRPGERGWVKVKHRGYWRFAQQLDFAHSGRRRVII